MIVRLYFIVVMTFLHGSASDCGFTTTFFKAAGLIMGKKSCLITDKLMVSVTNRVD